MKGSCLADEPVYLLLKALFDSLLAEMFFRMAPFVAQDCWDVIVFVSFPWESIDALYKPCKPLPESPSWRKRPELSKRSGGILSAFGQDNTGLQKLSRLTVFRERSKGSQAAFCDERVVPFCSDGSPTGVLRSQAQRNPCSCSCWARAEISKRPRRAFHGSQAMWFEEVWGERLTFLKHGVVVSGMWLFPRGRARHLSWDDALTDLRDHRVSSVVLIPDERVCLNVLLAGRTKVRGSARVVRIGSRRVCILVVHDRCSVLCNAPASEDVGGSGFCWIRKSDIEGLNVLIPGEPKEQQIVSSFLQRFPVPPKVPVPPEGSIEQSLSAGQGTLALWLACLLPREETPGHVTQFICLGCSRIRVDQPRLIHVDNAKSIHLSHHAQTRGMLAINEFFPLTIIVKQKHGEVVWLIGGAAVDRSPSGKAGRVEK